MLEIVTAIVFFVGVAIAILSVFLVTGKNKNKSLYAVPTLYSIVVNITFEKVTERMVDLWAMILFAAALALIGWAVVRFQMVKR